MPNTEEYSKRFKEYESPVVQINLIEQNFPNKESDSPHLKKSYTHQNLGRVNHRQMRHNYSETYFEPAETTDRVSYYDRLESSSRRPSSRKKYLAYDYDDPERSSLSRRKFKNIIEEAKRSVRKQLSAEKSRSRGRTKSYGKFSKWDQRSPEKKMYKNYSQKMFHGDLPLNSTSRFREVIIDHPRAQISTRRLLTPSKSGVSFQTDELRKSIKKIKAEISAEKKNYLKSPQKYGTHDKNTDSKLDKMQRTLEMIMNRLVYLENNASSREATADTLLNAESTKRAWKSRHNSHLPST